MEYLHNGFTLALSAHAFPLSTDSVALSSFVKLPRNAAVLDLGSGCGTLGLLLCANHPDCCVTGIEFSPEDHQTALDNARRNLLSDRLASICADLRSITDFIRPGSYDICVSNPPYFTDGFKSKTAARARHTDTCTLNDLFAAADHALKYGGDLFLVHKPEQLAQICATAAANHMEAKRLCLLRHKENGPVSLILAQCRKGGKPGLKIEEAALYHPDGSPTPFYNSLYHI